MKRLKTLAALIIALLLASCGQKNNQSWTLVGPDGTEVAGIKIADIDHLKTNKVTVTETERAWLDLAEKKYQIYSVRAIVNLIPTKLDSLPFTSSILDEIARERLGGRFTVNFISPGDSISVYEAMLMAGHETEMVLHALGWYIIKIDQGPYPHGACGWKFWTKNGSAPWQEVPCSTFDYLVYWGWQIAWRYGS